MSLATNTSHPLTHQNTTVVNDQKSMFPV